MRAALYCRVSRFDQEPQNQLDELQRYAEARGWDARPFVDHGVSGSKEHRPALDAMMKDAQRRRFDVIVCWRLDRLGRSLRHLIALIDEMTALGIGFVSLGESIDATTPSGRLQLHLLGAFAEFERSRIQERVRAGLARAKAQGRRLGRPVAAIPVERLATVAALSNTEAAHRLDVSVSTLKRWRRVQKTLTPAA